MINITSKYNISEDEFKKIKLMTSIFLFLEKNKEILQSSLKIEQIQKNIELPTYSAFISNQNARFVEFYEMNEDCLLATAGAIAVAISSPSIATPFTAGLWIASMAISLRSMQKSCK